MDIYTFPQPDWVRDHTVTFPAFVSSYTLTQKWPKNREAADICWEIGPTWGLRVGHDLVTEQQKDVHVNEQNQTWKGHDWKHKIISKNPSGGVKENRWDEENSHLAQAVSNWNIHP